MSKKPSINKKSRVLELLYMAREEVSVKDLERVSDNQLKEIHVWPEVGIMELTLPSGPVVDVETLTEFMNQEEDLKFMQDRQLKSVYAITVEEEALKELMGYVKNWIQEYGGLLCSDSDDFTPFYLE